MCDVLRELLMELPCDCDDPATVAALRIVTKLSTVEHLRDPPDGSPGLAARFAVAVSRCAAEGANSGFVRHYSSVCLERLCGGTGGLKLVSNNHHNPNDAREALAIIASLQECEDDSYSTTAAMSSRVRATHTHTTTSPRHHTTATPTHHHTAASAAASTTSNLYPLTLTTLRNPRRCRTCSERLRSEARLWTH